MVASLSSQRKPDTKELAAPLAALSGKPYTVISARHYLLSVFVQSTFKEKRLVSFFVPGPHPLVIEGYSGLCV